MIRNQWNKRLSLDRTYPTWEKITITAWNIAIIASPFKKIYSKEIEGWTTTLKDCRSLQQQNNSTNQILSTLSSQVDRIQDKLETPQIVSQIVTPQFLDRNLDKNRSIFKPTEVGNKIVKH